MATDDRAEFDTCDLAKTCREDVDRMISFAMSASVKSYNYRCADKRMWNVLRKSALEQPAIAAIVVVVVIVVGRKKVTVRVLPFAISRSGRVPKKGKRSTSFRRPSC
jgi:hypothetical protein